jgi:hypothetical protein
MMSTSGFGGFEAALVNKGELQQQHQGLVVSRPHLSTKANSSNNKEICEEKHVYSNVNVLLLTKHCQRVITMISLNGGGGGGGGGGGVGVCVCVCGCVCVCVCVCVLIVCLCTAGAEGVVMSHRHFDRDRAD